MNRRPKASAAFFKGHGHGNDYLVFFPGTEWDVSAEAVRRVCEPHRGVGSDGIVVVTTLEPRPGLRMFNPDGGEFERSGNGLRIAAAALYRAGRVGLDAFTVDVGGGPVELCIHGDPMAGVFDASAALGRATIGPQAVGLDPSMAADAMMPHPTRGLLDVVPVSVGNPHLVVFTDDLSDQALSDLGPFFSLHPGLASGSNVQLARREEDGLRIRIWERGVGRTSASGTSASAVAVAAVASGRAEPGIQSVRMDGGTFEIGVTQELEVTLRGPVCEIFEGKLSEGFLRTTSEPD